MGSAAEPCVYYVDANKINDNNTRLLKTYDSKNI